MKTVPPHALGVEVFREREVIGKRAVTTMERGIETRNLRQVRKTRKN